MTVRKVFFVFLLFESCVLTAQVKMSDGTLHFYNRLVWTGSSKALSDQQLLDAPAETLPVNFMDTLKKYNWYESGTYSFTDKALYSPFSGMDTNGTDERSRQFNYFSIGPTGVMHRNYVLKSTSWKIGFYTLTFDTATATRVKGISNIKGADYLVQENYGETEHLKIISYNNGILILETTRYGKPGEKPVMFRSAHMAYPKD